MNKTKARVSRLNSGKVWINTYSGQNIIKAYCKKYAVDKLCAIYELRILGANISENQESEIKRSIEELKEHRKKRIAELNPVICMDSDENFASIVGYTSGGVPYGITHEEMEEIVLSDENIMHHSNLVINM